MTDRLRSGLAFAATLAASVLAMPMPSFAQGQAMSLLPQEQAPRTPSLWSLFSTQSAPVPESPAAETEEQTEATPEPASPATRYKLVKVPLPPIPDRRTSGKTDAKANPKDMAKTGQKLAPALPQESDPVAVTVAPPPQPRPTGVFAMFAAYAQPEGEGGTSSGDSDIVRPALTPIPTTKVAPEPTAPVANRITKLDLSNPYKPRTLGTPGDKDDDLEDEEGTTKLVEKQVDSVQISCLKPELMALIYKAGDHFGDTPVITSGFRSHGRRGSHHRKCEAADFFIPNISGSQLVAYLKTLPGAGGVGTYCHTKSVHIDTGEPRNWHQCGRRRSFALRVPVVAGIGSR